MLWYKAWLETRWRFLIGLALLVCSAAAVVLTYPQVMKLMPMASRTDAGGLIGERIREAVDIARTYRGYLWSQWFNQNLSNMWTLFAVLLGTGGLLAQTSGGAALFTLSLPVSRAELMQVRALTGLAELLALAVVPSLLVPVLSPAVGQSYGVGDAIVHSLCLFVAGAVFFSLAFLLSTVFTDIWRPFLIVLFLSMALGIVEQLFRNQLPFGIFRVMSGERYFQGAGIPWIGLLATAGLSAAMLYGAAANISRRDF